jgi:hypothetical protein
VTEGKAVAAADRQAMARRLPEEIQARVARVALA